MWEKNLKRERNKRDGVKGEREKQKRWRERERGSWKLKEWINQNKWKVRKKKSKGENKSIKNFHPKINTWHINIYHFTQKLTF